MACSPENSGDYFAELHCISNFTFLRGASHPQELVLRAIELGYTAIALTDECSLSGVARAHIAAKGKIQFIVGSEFLLQCGLRMVLLATDRESYGRLSHLISVARCQAEKGSYIISREVIENNFPQDCLALWLPDLSREDAVDDKLLWLKKHFSDKLWIVVEQTLSGNDKATLETLSEIGGRYCVPLCASNNAHMHIRKRHVLKDTLTAIREGISICELGHRALVNSEWHLRSRQKLQALFPKSLLNETLKIAQRCRFSLDVLKHEYQYPRELVPSTYTPQSWLRHLVEKGAREKWPEGEPARVRDVIEKELRLIAELRYESYFLTVYDIVRYARNKRILCQGRGSAANSVVCYCLGITSVDPSDMQLLFERFVSKERNEPPDIDVDFEHERREEVIQYIYEKYGPQRAALAATVITYRTRSAIRDVGKALGMGREQIDHIAKSISWWDKDIETRLHNSGYQLDGLLIKQFVYLVNEITGFPRHLSQHVGGFVISEGRLTELVPIENASMPDRRVIQWEKDDLEALGLMKIDVLALGMLTAIRKALALIGGYEKKPALEMHQVPREDPRVYKMIQKADTIGVFQIESRAQMSMLPRLRPANYYDLVIQIAIVRPGPIQGDMVHPYLRRRNKLEDVAYPHPEVEPVFERTLGVPIFQEQVMHFAMVAADYSAGEADQLRRDMAAWKRKGGLEPHREKLFERLRKKDYPEEYIERIFEQIKGFGDYGFPESHSASFAHLAYVSSWLKCYYPAAFACALINSWPMGFYPPNQLVQDARRHDVEVRPVDVNASDWDCTLERNALGNPALRLGLRMVKGFSEQTANALCEVRKDSLFTSVADITTRLNIDSGSLESLAAADALCQLSGNRHNAFWQVSGVEKALPLLPASTDVEAEPLLRKPEEAEDVLADYRQVDLTLRRHPLALVREQLSTRGNTLSSDLRKLKTNTRAKVAGLVTGRQRPGTASGVVFVTLEDEAGFTNVIVWPKLAAKQHKVLLQADLMEVRGVVQFEDNVLHLVAHHLVDLTGIVSGLAVKSRNFH